MFFKWLKHYMPRGLYGRAALILILPVVTLQLVVSVIFIQRHFEDVTEQLSGAVVQELSLVLTTDAMEYDLAQQLGYDVEEIGPDAVPPANSRRWFDLSGRRVTRTLLEGLEGALRVDLPDDWTVHVYVDAEAGLYRVTFDRRRASASNPHQLLVNMLFFGGFMTVIAFFYLRNQLRPITRLALAAEAFGRGRFLPYSPSGAVEVRAAGNAFLDMRARIERQIEQRTMMLSGVSHDLRTPLTRLRLAVSMLDDDDRTEMERDINEMQQLLDAFLDFARSDAETGETETVDAMPFVRQIVEAAARSGKPVVIGDLIGSGQVQLRPLAVRRAVENLIGNAMRYGTNCRVSARLGERSLRIRVEDDGPGIPEARREEALKPFVRLDPARNQDKGSGVGLGLAIAADIARSHGGVLRLGDSDTMGGLCADLVLAR
ncbi:ATP-binding protein [Pseudoprimorskyibacter insulae]|uniref:histidine kinase n=1 Tax=Pseudoprimorskyibacter insulae TaxID=1695997 RepID=A0A2R8B0Q5_9RHOB|nr:ATP-binding protein [Pseudoprimorskyibacter insulae]SPF81851.1 Osmolarity sensor protein EnvZ [Pseudoprimorskyibacter insulae]